MQTYEVLIGERIDNAIRKALDMASVLDDYVCFTFNGVEMTVQPGGDADDIERQWKAEMDRRGEEYRNSPEGKERARQRREPWQSAKHASMR